MAKAKVRAKAKAAVVAVAMVVVAAIGCITLTMTRGCGSTSLAPTPSSDHLLTILSQLILLSLMTTMASMIDTIVGANVVPYMIRFFLVPLPLPMRSVWDVASR